MIATSKNSTKEKPILNKVGSLQHAENSTATDEVRISTRASQIEGNSKPLKMHTKSQRSLNLASLISPKHTSTEHQQDTSTKFATSVKSNLGNKHTSLHKKKFSEPALNFRPVAHVIEERSNKHMINNYFKTLQSEKQKEKSGAPSKVPNKSHKALQQHHTQGGNFTPAKTGPKKAVPLLQIAPFNDFEVHDKRKPESSQLYKKLLDMLNCPSKEGSASMKPTTRTNIHNQHSAHNLHNTHAAHNIHNSNTGYNTQSSHNTRQNYQK